jgi:hypothetical protein
MDFLAWLEELSFSHWLNESPRVWGYPMFLFMHTLGMSVVAGGSAVVNLAILGIWPRTPLRPLARLFPVLMWGFAVNAVTGVSIFLKDATSYGRNVDFYVKLLFVLGGMWILRRLRRRVFGDPHLDAAPLPPVAKRLAWASLVCWLGAIVCGRLIAYLGPVAGL